MTQAIPILLYHNIAPLGNHRYRSQTVAAKTFESHMAYFSSHRYTPITVSHLVQAMTDHSQPLPHRPVLITFDDGFADFYTDALPILANYNFPATLYIATGYVGKTSGWLQSLGEGSRLMLTWSQIDEISRSGIECGSHSHNHLQLDILPRQIAQEEITRSKMVLEQHLGQPILSFAYPYGYHNMRTEALVQRAGYASACAVRNALSSREDHRYALSRVEVKGNLHVSELDRLLTHGHLETGPMSERLRTKAWRFVRRWDALLRGSMLP